MISYIAGILIIALILGLAVLILRRVVRLLQSETTSRLTKAVVCLLATILIVLFANFVIRLQHTPPAQPISDVLDLTDASRQLSIRSVRMPAPAYVSGTGTIEKSYTSTVAVEIANNSNQQVYLGLDYYTDSGRIGLYSPGATSEAKIVPVPANWTGELQYPLRHLRFVAGGYVKITLAKCKITAPQGVYLSYLPPDSEQLFEKKYDMVALKKPTR